eukprot:gene6166-10173_t
MTSVLLLGSTGGTGKNILRLLVQNSNYKIKLLVRDLNKAQKTLTSDYSSISEEALKKVELIEGSITEINQLNSDLFDVDFILHTAASNSNSKQTEQFIGFEGMKNIIQFAKKSKKLKKIIYVTSGKVTRPFHPISILLNSFTKSALKWKLEAENLLRESGLPYVICRPSGGLTNDTNNSPIEFGVGDFIGSSSVSRASVGECVMKCMELDIDTVTFEMINSSTKTVTNWKEMTSLPKDSFTTIKRNHDIPFYIIYSITFGVLAFAAKKYFF